MPAFHQLLMVANGTGQGTVGTVFLQNATSSITTTSYGLGFAYSFAGFQIVSTGTIFSLTDGIGDITFPRETFSYPWITNGSPSLYSMRATALQVNGAFVESAAFNVWLPMTSSYTWSMNTAQNFTQGSSGVSSRIRIELALNTNLNNILATAEIRIIANAITQAGDIP